MDEETKGWLNDQAISVIAHRRGGDFAKGDGRHPIAFGEDDGSPVGRRVVLNDSMKSSYRVRNNQVVEVDRTMGTDHFTITVLETTPVAGGKFLPRHFTVTYFDAKTGVLKRSEAFTDEYKQKEFEQSRLILHNKFSFPADAGLLMLMFLLLS